MAIATWDDRFLLGFPDLDRDHRILFDLINQLHDAYANGRGDERLDVVFSVLGDYVNTHFRREEDLLRTCQYPRLVPHLAAHAVFSADVDDMFRRYRQNGNEKLVIELLAMLTNWWHFHVLEDDADYGHYIRDKTSVSG
jgi:hemerythrin-like metal-binding protein